ncbi:hypothetical protein ACIRQQ_33870 [Streptomyces fuscichromogenes]|uniref:hypothetical protein n=1 Tax=Streptomyces fuscichromogenes TaxID=1324013 RepID=UPI0037F54696
MNTPMEFVKSELPDLGEIALWGLRSQSPDIHARALDRLLRQVEQPRVNFAGGETPTRRVD